MLQVDLTYILNDTIKVLIGGGIGLGIKALFHLAGSARVKKAIHLLEAKHKIVADAVKFAEQVYKDYDGKDKFAMAVHWATEQFATVGIKVTDSQLQGLIEVAVKDMQGAVKAEVQNVEAPTPVVDEPKQSETVQVAPVEQPPVQAPAQPEPQVQPSGNVQA